MKTLDEIKEIVREFNPYGVRSESRYGTVDGMDEQYTEGMLTEQPFKVIYMANLPDNDGFSLNPVYFDSLGQPISRDEFQAASRLSE